jgi:hypothetical protein
MMQRHLNIFSLYLLSSPLAIRDFDAEKLMKNYELGLRMAVLLSLFCIFTPCLLAQQSSPVPCCYHKSISMETPLVFNGTAEAENLRQSVNQNYSQTLVDLEFAPAFKPWFPEAFIETRKESPLINTSKPFNSRQRSKRLVPTPDFH